MQIGTAAPTPEELAGAKHHFIHHKSIKDNYNVGAFEKDALQCLETLFKTHNILVMVGGSGLYVDALTKGLDHFPEVDPEIRKTLNKKLEQDGLETLQNQLQTLDPISFNTIAIDNPHRVIRALEICIGTGKPYSSFLNKDKEKRHFKAITIGLTADRDLIYQRINQRVDIMMQEGLLDEVKGLLEHKNLNALNTVGYKELFNHLSGAWDLDFAISEIKKNTRRFAKRQLTWFKRNDKTLWFDYKSQTLDIINKINSRIKEAVLDNPVWFSLTEIHTDKCINYDKVKFYKTDYAPFGAFIDGADTAQAIEKYSKLIDTFFVVGKQPKLPTEFKPAIKYIGLQMILRKKTQFPITETIIELQEKHLEDLMGLIKLVYPHFFKEKTSTLGRYYGIYKNNLLVAALGERMQTKHFTEISAVATHPDYLGNGYAKQLLTHASNKIFEDNKVPFLHVDETNLGPIHLYKKLGFITRIKIEYWKISG
ncbi:tRNA (adenosine(37)-N6)-dimethylallyltransferase MiaA [Algibacter marinivivus]|uniref:tRNA dimethylallyltransferase n=2 Tax=Algibacter marinivivus TaxID=2100723 RepID=A0A2U2X2Q2_9FLAO|nr:tRNA (adenosine(37)-N6)-dimethylallyltransferase MiaA [Algibacter marinivivus]